MASRIARQLRLFSDRDVLHTLAFASAVCVFSAGLVYVGYFAHVLRIALHARGIAPDAPLLLESQSRDTLRNLRNARDLLRTAAHRGRVTLLSNRRMLSRVS